VSGSGRLFIINAVRVARLSYLLLETGLNRSILWPDLMVRLGVEVHEKYTPV
jgi:hypothetical protein